MITRNWWMFMKDDFERQVQRIARQFEYPPTPVVRARVQRGPRYGRALAAVAVLVVVILITPVRATLLDWLRIGVITIYPDSAPVVTPLPSLLHLYGETTLADVQQAVDFDLRLPAGFGPPDHVYEQSADGQAVVLVWLSTSDRPAISLYQFGPESNAYGKFLDVHEDAAVNGQPAAWADLPHRLQYDDGRQLQSFLIEGNVLIWREGRITYRLESELTLQAAIAIAESLQ